MTEFVYADSSALVKLVRTEDESPDLRRFLDRRGSVLASSRLAEVEVHRAGRIGLPEDLTLSVNEVLARCELAAIDDKVLARARDLVSARLRTLDAIHLATALKLESRDFLTYDRRLIDAAAAEGLRVLSPGLDG